MRRLGLALLLTLAAVGIAAPAADAWPWMGQGRADAIGDQVGQRLADRTWWADEWQSNGCTRDTSRQFECEVELFGDAGGTTAYHDCWIDFYVGYPSLFNGRVRLQTFDRGCSS